jgi:hypothetical protein
MHPEESSRGHRAELVRAIFTHARRRPGIEAPICQMRLLSR